MREFFYKFKWRRFHPSSFARYEELVRSESLPPDEMHRIHEVRLQEVVRYAFQNSPFYRSFYCGQGFSLSDIGGKGWFENLPVVTKFENTSV